ncbi:glycosyl transferase family 51 [Rhodoferax sediminis]|uniref:peptidoglycan glycosyltransferase n=1 Tax=Rhodoferax sediminis TaxID=2509614 RepID=A0A515DH86_9BURK|nr:glycosyl transferase family 51 [Rhodoferax sediminis]
MLAAFFALAYVVYQLVSTELQTSRWQAHHLAQLGRKLTVTVAPGPSDAIRFPGPGPYDERLGYAQLPEFTARLRQRGFAIAEQARMSPRMTELVDDGLFTPYHEKTQAGLELFDCNGQALYAQRYPQRVYPSFSAVPQVLVHSLLFIENHNLLNPEYPLRNPAIDWRRFSRASADQVLHLFSSSRATPGGSTLATQIEKYRHSPDGQTGTGAEKLRQMASASVRAYLGGEVTLPWREQIVLDYLNTVPLSGSASHGEVQGLGDGLWTWYGDDFAEVNRLLQSMDGSVVSARQAQVFKEALSLMIAQRRPSPYLLQDRAALNTMTDRYLRLLARAGTIPQALRDAALAVQLQQARPVAPRASESFVERKAVTSLRTGLSALLGVDSLYHLDRLDLRAGSTIDQAAQQAITDALQRVRTPDGARAAGLYGRNMLQAGDDPGRLTFSVTLYEQQGGANLLRTQADSVDQPFDINSGARLNLGSTAKLRTLVTYLEIISALHQRLGGLSPAELRRLPVSAQDVLSRWASDYLTRTPGASLQAMLEAAMERKYSGNAGEAFATGGGLQSFENFEPWENTQEFTVRVGFQNSVNLVFVRLMRDIVRYEIHQIEPGVDQWLADPDSPQRREYLARFIDQESSTFMRRFYGQYQGKTVKQALDLMFAGKRVSPVALAVALRSVDPSLGEAQFGREMRQRLAGPPLSDDALHKLYVKYGVDKFSLRDRGYLAHVHPLALWLVEALRRQPNASLKQVLDDSATVRQDVYAWLTRARISNAQTNRIRQQLEVAAFVRIGQAWRRLGYPFGNLTPSLATAVGASGDRPASLAELMGLIVGDGVQRPIRSLHSLDFAVGTPYETRFVAQAQPQQRLLAPEITTLVRRSLQDVVEGGTAKSLRGTFTEAVGGKTGTGDQRFETYGPGGRLLGSRRVSRSATFVFFVGERMFGTITAYVHEPYAARYSFTSAMAVQFLKSVAPTVHAMAAGSGGTATPLTCRSEPG